MLCCLPVHSTNPALNYLGEAVHEYGKREGGQVEGKTVREYGKREGG